MISGRELTVSNTIPVLHGKPYEGKVFIEVSEANDAVMTFDQATSQQSKSISIQTDDFINYGL